MGREIVIPHDILFGMESLREAGINMLDLQAVLKTAAASGHEQTAEWIAWALPQYIEGLTRGFKDEAGRRLEAFR